MEAVRTTVVNIKKGEPYDILITRPGPFSNPWSHIPGAVDHDMLVTSRMAALYLYRDLLRVTPELIERIKSELKGKRLGCVCKPQPCHGDILARIANGEEW